MLQFSYVTFRRPTQKSAIFLFRRRSVGDTIFETVTLLSSAVFFRFYFYASLLRLYPRRKVDLSSISHCSSFLSGRAIRHRRDYACIILLDQRYSKKSVQNKLPSWIQSRLHVHPRFGPAFAALNKVLRLYLFCIILTFAIMPLGQT